MITLRIIFLLILLTTNLSAENIKDTARDKYITYNAVAQNQKGIREYSFKVEGTYPHDGSAYTQGLFFYKGVLYESCGQYRESSFRKVDYKSGKVLQSTPFNKKYFLEGACVLNDILYILTWKEGTCFVYDISTMKKLSEFRYKGEGWGLTSDGKYLIMSDGTSTLRFLDPKTFWEVKRITVKLKGKEIFNLNELEYINGEIWANLYGEDFVVMINPETGELTGRLDCRNLFPESQRGRGVDVLNGIAYNSLTDEIFLTGKYWPKLYKISLQEKKIEQRPAK